MNIMYRFFTRHSGEFFHGTLQLYMCNELDASKELAHYVGTSQEEYHLKRLRFIKDATAGGVKYYSKAFNADAVEIRWQANAAAKGSDMPDGSWYAPSIECRFREEELSVLALLQKRLKKSGVEPDYIKGVTPREILRALEPVHVQYSSHHYDLWYGLDHEPENIDKAPIGQEEPCSKNS